MGLFWSNSWSLALIFCTHAKKNLTFNLSKFGGQIQRILFFMIFPIFWITMAAVPTNLIVLMVTYN